MSTTTTIQLDKKTCDELLVQYLDIGYKNSKTFSIREGAIISKHLDLLTGAEKDEKVSTDELYVAIYNILEKMNKNGAFSLGDAALLEKIGSYLKEHVLTKPKQKEEPKKKEEEPRFKEL